MTELFVSQSNTTQPYAFRANPDDPDTIIKQFTIQRNPDISIQYNNPDVAQWKYKNIDGISHRNVAATRDSAYKSTSHTRRVVLG